MRTSPHTIRELREGNIEIGGSVIQPGTSARVSLPAFTDLDGSVVSVPLHVISGARPGPTLTLLSMLHGDEWSMLQTLAELLDRVDPTTVSGTLLVVPIGNPYAFRQLRRTSRETLEFDNADLNRAFPGGEGWLTQRIAQVIAREVLDRTTHLIDFHPGPFGATWMQVVVGRDLPEDIVRRSESMARAFGVTCIWRSSGFPGPHSASGYAASRSVPGIVVEIGGLGFDERLEAVWREQNIDGVFGVMEHLGMLAPISRAARAPREFVAFTKSWVVRPTISGLLIPAIGPERLATEVAAGELLGRVISPMTFEELELLRAPSRGLLFCVPRSYPVQPHNYSFGAAALDDPETVRSA